MCIRSLGRNRLTMNHQKDSVSCQQVWKNCARFGAFHDRVHGVNNRLKPVEALNTLNYGWNRGIERRAASGDAIGDMSHETRGRMAQKECEDGSSKQ